MLLLLSGLASAFCTSLPWTCETAFIGTPLSDVAVGGGIVADNAQKDVWLVTNRVLNVGPPNGFNNQVYSARVDCSVDGCMTHAPITWQTIAGAVRTGVSELNTAPSLALNPGTLRVSFLAMRDDTTCVGGTEKALYKEFLRSYALDLVADYIVDDRGCDDKWAHGLITYNGPNNAMRAGATIKMPGNEDVFVGKREIGTITWTAPLTPVAATESDHYSYAHAATSGANRWVYHNKVNEDIVFASPTAELKIGETGDWPSIVLDKFANPNVWRVVWAEDVVGNTSRIVESSCPVTLDCMVLSNWNSNQPPTQIYTSSYPKVRALELVMGDDGSKHMGWVNNDPNSSPPHLRDRLRPKVSCSLPLATIRERHSGLDFGV